MPTVYLVDAHTNPVANSEINEMRFNAQTAPLAGVFVVKVDDDMPLRVSPPNTLSLLLGFKNEAVLSYFATFTIAQVEDFTDAPSVDFANSPGTHAGARNSTKINPRVGGLGGRYQSTSTNIGSTPTVASIVWEEFTVSNTNPKTDRFTRSWNEATTSLTCEVSFNNGGTWVSATNRGILTIAAPDQGSDLIVRFTNNSGSSKYLGYWAVLY